MLFGKMYAMVDTVAEFTGIKHTVASIAVGINNAVGSRSRHQAFLSVGCFGRLANEGDGSNKLPCFY